jgi:hypothetical protein
MSSISCVIHAGHDDFSFEIISERDSLPLASPVDVFMVLRLEMSHNVQSIRKKKKWRIQFTSYGFSFHSSYNAFGTVVLHDLPQ